VVVDHQRLGRNEGCSVIASARSPFGTFFDTLRRIVYDGVVVAMPERPCCDPARENTATEGPVFVEHIRTFLYLAAKHRVRLLLSMLGQDISTTV
jgi:hypothetical protein